MTVEEGKWRLEWVNLGEGVCGDYDPEDPNDVNYLRADLYERVAGVWQPVDDGSYCTLAPVGTAEDTLRVFSHYLFSIFGNRFRKRDMEAWTWTTEVKS